MRRLLLLALYAVLASGCMDDPTREGAVVGETSVRAFAATPDGRRAAYGTEAGNVVLLEITQEGGSRLLWRKCAHREAVASIALSPDGRGLLSASTDDAVVRWDTERAKARRVFEREEGGHAVGFSPDGRRAFALDSGHALRVLTFAAGDRGIAPLTTLDASAAVFGPDSDHLVAETRDGFVTWDAPRGKTGETRFLPWPRGQGRADRTLVLAKDGKSVLCAGPAGIARWDLERNVALWETKLDSACEAVAFAAAETRVLALDRLNGVLVVRVLDAATGDERRVVAIKDRLPGGHVADRVAFAADGRVALVLCDVEDGKKSVVRVALAGDLE